MGYIGQAPANKVVRTADIEDSAITSAKILDGTIVNADVNASAAIAESKLTVSSFDDTDLRSDIMTLALKEAITENRVAYNLPNAMIEQFQDDSKIGTETTGDRNASEYWGTVNTAAPADAGGTQTDWVDGNLYFASVASNDDYGDGNDIGVGASYNYSYWSQTALLTSDFRHEVNGTTRNNSTTADVDTANYLEFGITSQQGTTVDHTAGNAQQNNNLTVQSACSHSAANPFIFASTGGYGNDIMLRKNNSGTRTAIATIAGSEWGTSDELSFARNGSTLYFMINGVIKHTFVSGDFNTSGNLYGVFGFGVAASTNWLNCHYRSELSTVKGVSTTSSATGTLISTANTANAAQTKVSGVILYKNEDGTATLGTDLKIYFTCDGGSNWTESTPTAAGTFSSGILMAKCPEVTCTSGTDIRYKAVWANQSEGSKETQLHGVGMNY